MAIVRKQGQIVKEESLRERVERLGAEAPALSTAKGAASVGATPMQTAMAASGQRKEAMQKEAVQAAAPVAKEQTLAGTQRLQEQQATATAAQQAQQAQAETLQQLGSLSARVPGLVQEHFAKAAEEAVGVPGGVDDQALATLFGAATPQAASVNQSYVTAKDVLAQLQTVTDPAQRENLLVTLYSTPTGTDPATGQPVYGLKDIDIAQLMSMGVDATTAQAAKNIAKHGGNITLGEFDITQLGFANKEDLAAALGVPVAQVDGMTLDDLQKNVANQQQATYQRAQALQARALATPPGSARQQIIQNQMRQMSEQGVIGVESQVAELVEDLDIAETVDFGGERIEVSELLKDDFISDKIKQFLEADPDERDRLFPPGQYPEFRGWLDRNQLALADAANSVRGAQSSFNQLQTSYQNMNQFLDENGVGAVLSPEVMKTIMPNWQPGQSVTTAQMQALKEAFRNSPWGEMESQNRVEFIDNMKYVEANKKYLPALEGMDATQIGRAIDTGQLIGSDPGAADFFDTNPATNPFIVDADLQQRIGDIMTVERPELGGKTYWESIGNSIPEATHDPNFQNLPLEHIGAILQAPNPKTAYVNFDDNNDYAATLGDLENISDPVAKMENALDFIFGSQGDVSLDSLNAAFAKYSNYARMGDPESASKLALFKQIFGGDGRPNVNSFASVMTYLRSGMKPPGQLNLDPVNVARNPLNNAGSSGMSVPPASRAGWDAIADRAKGNAPLNADELLNIASGHFVLPPDPTDPKYAQVINQVVDLYKRAGGVVDAKLAAGLLTRQQTSYAVTQAEDNFVNSLGVPVDVFSKSLEHAKTELAKVINSNQKTWQGNRLFMDTSKLFKDFEGVSIEKVKGWQNSIKSQMAQVSSKHPYYAELQKKLDTVNLVVDYHDSNEKRKSQHSNEPQSSGKQGGWEPGKEASRAWKGSAGIS